jgi:VanZ family protein
VHRVSLWLPPLAYMSVIFFLSSQPQPLPDLTSRVWDKALHMIEYTGLGVLLFRALAGEGLTWLATALLTVAIVSAYGASDEWHQSFVPMRNADVRDWIVDTLGGTVAAVAAAMAAGRWPSRK